MKNKKYYSKREAAKILRTAAKDIETFGWVQLRFGNEEIGFCALGALGHASLGAKGELSGYVARYALRKVVGEPTAFWNDKVGRTSKEVTHAMRQAAAKLEHGLKVEAPL